MPRSKGTAVEIVARAIGYAASFHDALEMPLRQLERSCARNVSAMPCLPT
jgi:hypothetical protein